MKFTLPKCWICIDDKRNIVFPRQLVNLFSKLDILHCRFVFLTELKDGSAACECFLYTTEKFCFLEARGIGDKIKCCIKVFQLFLGAGAIIVCCHHEQDIWKMGGLARRMPLTVLCFLMGTFALIAVPGFSGFFSKEAILDAAIVDHPVFFWIGAGVAAITTFYMTRLCLVAFLGKARAHGAEHAHEAGATMVLPLLALAAMAIISGYGFVADYLVPAEGFTAPGFHFGCTFSFPPLTVTTSSLIRVLYAELRRGHPWRR